MEEYRRKYMSPTYRQSATTDNWHRSSTISELKHQLQECKDMEGKFDELSMEILKLQRQNKKIQGQKGDIQSQYMEKISQNKIKIQGLKKDVRVNRESIGEKMDRVRLIDQENEGMRAEIDRIQVDRVSNHLEMEEVKAQMTGKGAIAKEIQDKIEEGKNKAAALNSKCKEKSQELKEGYQQLKIDEQNLKEEEESNQELRKKLQALAKQRQMWEKQVQADEAEAKVLKEDYSLAKEQQNGKEIECLNLQKQNRRNHEECMRNKSDCKKVMMENGELASKLNAGQQQIFSSLINLDKSREYLEKMSLKEVELRKQNEKMSETVTQQCQTLREQQQSYNRIINHMRQSIQQDEQAIQSLVRQATTMETMIN